MSFYEKASLILPVSPAYKDGALQSYKPLTSEGTFAFSRGSNLAATRINKAGLVEKGRENLAKQSNNFDTAPWGRVNTSVTPNATTAPDGTLTASKIVANTANTQHRIDQGTTSSAGVKTFSVYLKQSEITSSWVRIGASGCFIDLTNGNLSSIASGIIASSVSLSNDWYRLSITKTNASANEIIRVNAGVDDYIGDNVIGIFVWNAQYEEGLVATDYIPTTTTTGTAGILEDTPRFNYSNGVSCSTLLLEPSRGNEFPDSEGLFDFSKSGATITNNQGLSPEGVNNASLFQVTSTNQPRIENNANVSLVYAVSIFVKSDIGDYFGMGWFQSDVGNSFAKFNINNGTFDSYTGTQFSGAKIENYGNGWYRISAKLITTSGLGKSGVKFVGMSFNSPLVGDLGNRFFLYGAQLELGTYATSYIPTYGTSQTRASDVCVGAGSASTFNSNEGVLYAELAALADDGTFRILSISNGTRDERIYIQYKPTSNEISGVAKNNDTTQANISFVLSDETQFAKIAFKYKANDFALYVNGVIVGTDTSGTTPVGLNEFSFDQGNRANNFYGKVKEVLTFNSALSNGELSDLTNPYKSYNDFAITFGFTWESQDCTNNSIAALKSLS